MRFDKDTCTIGKIWRVYIRLTNLVAYGQDVRMVFRIGGLPEWIMDEIINSLG